MRPKTITTFEILSWIGVAALVIELLILLVLLADYGPRAFREPAVIFSLVLTVGIIVALAVSTPMAARKRSAAGKWIFVITTAIMTILALIGLASGRTNALNLLLTLLHVGVLVAAAVMLFVPASTAWFKGQTYNPYGGGYGGGGYPPAPGGYPPQGGYGQPGGYPPQQGGGYPPQGGQPGGFPTQQGGGYPPQGGQPGGYPPQQSGYPPQQGGYPPQGGQPPQQGGYPPPGGGYPPSGGN